MWDNPIVNNDDAKKYFTDMGCSHFHMSREYPERYNEYKLINIDNQTEKKWRQEAIEQKYIEIIKENKKTDLWALHSRMAELINELKSVDNLIRILDATKYIKLHNVKSTNVLVAETIVGRHSGLFSNGLIKMAKKLGRKDIAKEFSSLVEFFADADNNKYENITRCKEALLKSKKLI